MKAKTKLTRLEKSWILYDVGNSAFILLASTLLQIFFSNSIGEEANNFAWWALAGSLSTALVAVIGPICGTLADLPGFKKPMFAISVILGAASCVGMGLTDSWKVFWAMYIVAKVGVSSSFVFYDAMLVEVTDPDRADDVSAKGYAMGYIGSTIPFVLCLVLYIFQGSLGLTTQMLTLLCCGATSLWWVACTVPLLLHYKQLRSLETKTRNPLKNTFAELGNTLRHAKKHPNILLYLIAFFFFINGVETIITLATSYGTSLGLNDVMLLLALLLTQIIAFPATIVFGKLSQSVATGKLLKICIASYTAIALFAMFLVAQWQFWLLAGLVGCFQGAIQALSRSYMSKIIPAERSGSYFGLMDICGKGAAFLGSTIVALISTLLEDATIPPIFGLQLQPNNFAVGALVILFIVGFAVFCKADKLNTET